MSEHRRKECFTFFFFFLNTVWILPGEKKKKKETFHAAKFDGDFAVVKLGHT